MLLSQITPLTATNRFKASEPRIPSSPNGCPLGATFCDALWRLFCGIGGLSESNQVGSQRFTMILSHI